MILHSFTTSFLIHKSVKYLREYMFTHLLTYHISKEFGQFLFDESSTTLWRHHSFGILLKWKSPFNLDLFLEQACFRKSKSGGYLNRANFGRDSYTSHKVAISTEFYYYKFLRGGPFVKWPSASPLAPLNVLKKSKRFSCNAKNYN